MTDKLLINLAVVEQALEAFDGGSWEQLRAAEALRAALKNEFNTDWDRVEALRESLREHMADVRQLRAALAWIASHKNSDWPERCQQIVAWARAALAEQPAGQEPVGWRYQHDETGRHMCHSNDGVNTPEDFMKINPRWKLIGPLYTAPPPAKPAEQEPEGSVCGRCGGLVFDPILPQPAKPAERVPLTDDEICNLADAVPGDKVTCYAPTWHIRFARAIEAKILEQFK